MMDFMPTTCLLQNRKSKISIVLWRQETPPCAILMGCRLHFSSVGNIRPRVQRKLNKVGQNVPAVVYSAFCNAVHMAVQQRRNAQVVRFSPLPLKRFEGRCNRARAHIKRAGSFYAVRFAFLFCFAQFLNCLLCGSSRQFPACAACPVHRQSVRRGRWLCPISPRYRCTALL